MRALVTGANGLLGGNLCRELLDTGHQVRALVREGSDHRTLEGLEVDTVLGDVRDAAALRAAADGCEVIYHCAAVFSYWGFDKEEMYATAEAGAKNAVDAAKDAGVRRMVLTSTTAIQGGNRGREVFDESSRPDLDSYPDYFKSKAIQEQSALARGREVGLEVIAACPTLMLGPYDFRPSAALPTVTSYITAPLMMTFDGGINAVHARDVAKGHVLLADRGEPFERYNLGTENLEWPAIHGVLSELSGLPRAKLKVFGPVAYIAAMFFELGAWITKKPPMATRELAKQQGVFFWYDSSKARALGYAPRPSREVLADTLAWLLGSDHLTPGQKKRLKPNDEVTAVMAVYG